MKNNETAVLVGAKQIGEALNVPAKKIYTLLSTNSIPCVFKLGGKIAARRASLEQWLIDLETEAKAAA